MQEDKINENNSNIDNARPFWRDIISWFTARTVREEDITPADVAYCKATYGTNTDVQTLIKLHQHRINNLINDKTTFKTNGDTFADYRCVYSFPKDITPYISKILEPFKEKGYKIINISDKVDELSNDNVYLISWYKDNL